MENSIRFGLMAVLAVSGSMVLLAHQVHKRILSNFMKKFEFEMGGVSYTHGHKNLGGSEKHNAKKKVRFAKQVLEFPLEKKSYCRKVARAQQIMDKEVLVMENIHKWKRGPKLEDNMPHNRAALYKGIIKYRTIKGKLHV
ncbi:PREDICTED: uncharacterized protein LOC109334102 [Lupinus angustifolius]|uniref:uncharacterized protein LOC109334102 n=1 Tax=Lupinus angustifolius TaxID=3871 RepID=UPI00092FD2C2|nr:PREDICTED: uncharacterized protein LOC109334102 [Lupinus angustifolius]